MTKMLLGTTLTIEQAIEHLRNKKFMGGVNRSEERIDKNDEFFTPTPAVQLILEKFVNLEDLKNENTSFIDNSAGDGQILSEIMILKLKNGISFEKAISNIYGVELMKDNVKLCQERLLCNQKQFRSIIEKNIVCADALRYHYRFDGTAPYKTDQDLHFDQLFTE
jgi:hypothetical protein